MGTVELLVAGAGILLMLIMVLVAVLIKMSRDEKKSSKTQTKEVSIEQDVKPDKQGYNKQSIFEFMEFDQIDDNMIIQKDSKRYLMVLECQGINYDLMSGIERVSVEEGFAQFLNTLRHPIQIYTQTRTINLDSSLDTYKKRLEDIKLELERKELKYKQMQNAGDYTPEELSKQNIEIVRDRNLYEYGKDIIKKKKKMSLNKSVLRKQYYVIIPYYSTEAGNDLLDKEEIRNLAFSELYTKAQSLSRVLAGCSVSSKVMDSYELADLLYTAYNRDESETYGLDKAIKSGYDDIYTTAPDALEKKMEELDREIEKRAYELAEQAVGEARTETQKRVERKERSIEDFISDMAMSIINENEQYIGKEVAKEANNKIKNRKTTKEGGKTNGEKQTKGTRNFTKTG
jgi:hypothetical protein